MRKATVFLLFAVLCLLPVPAQTAEGPAAADIQKADTLITKALEEGFSGQKEKAGEKLKTAHKILKSVLAKHSRNQEAMFHLGRCLFILDKEKHFQIFQELYQMNASYGQRIYDFHIQMARKMEKANVCNGSSICLRELAELKAITTRFCPAQKAAVSRSLIREARRFFQQGKTSLADKYLEVVRETIPGSGSMVAPVYFDQGVGKLQKGNLAKACDYFRQTSALTDEYNEEIASRLFQCASRAWTLQTRLKLYDLSLKYSSRHKSEIIERLKQLIQELGANTLEQIRYLPEADKKNLKKAL